MVGVTPRFVITARPRPRRRRWPYVLGAVLLAVVIVAVLFRWDWVLPFVESRASATLGRQVTAQHMHVQLGRVTRITFEDVRVANPADWPKGGDFGTAQHLAISINAARLLRTRQVVIPMVALDHPAVDAERLADGSDNWSFNLGGGGSTKIGEVWITDGAAHVVDPRVRADFQLAFNTTGAPGSQPGGEATLHATANGTYAEQPITGEFTGGSVLSLRDTKHPYPVDLHLANGPTRASIVGTVQDPLSFQGANLKLALEGPDMQRLYPLTGIATPPTPPYRVSGNLDYQKGSMKFTHVAGTIGKSDVSGDISVTRTGKPMLDATLASRRVDLQDLAGFIGSAPGHSTEPGQTPQQRAEVKRAEVSPKLIPDTPVSLPKLNALDVHLHYKADHILGRGQPLDDLVADLDIVDGKVTLHPLSFGIGGGQLKSQIALAEAKIGEENAGLRARADVDFLRIPINKLLSAAGGGHGTGTISGRAVFEGTGTSLAGILGHGSGEVKLYMARGGELSALLVDLSGLEFGNAVLSALGLPQHARIQCLVADAKLQDGVVRPQPLVLDTTEALINVTGEANLLTEALALQLRTQAKHFTIGSLPAPIDISGTFKHPSIRPDLAAVAARGGIAAALGIVGTPLAALIPTIQFGTDDKGVCSGLTRAEAPPHVPPHVRRREPARPLRRRR